MRRVRVSRNLRSGNRFGSMRSMPRGSSLSRGGRGSRRRIPIRLMIAAGILLFGVVRYYGSSAVNPVTGQSQRVSLKVEEEIAIGLQAQPTMIAQHGGLALDTVAQYQVDVVGAKLLAAIGQDTPWQFEFHLLADPQTINAFALPGGQVFITMALYSQLETEGQLAGVLGHEIGHVIERHGSQRMAKGQLTQILVSAGGVASDGMGGGQAAAAIGKMINMSYGRGDELESDRWGIELLANAGYDPRAMIGVMRILKAAGGDRSQPEFFSSHPDPENRMEKIDAAILEVFPNGVPAGLIE